MEGHPARFVRIEHDDLPGELVTFLFFEHNEVPPDGATLAEFREFFNRVGEHILSPDGTLTIRQDMWTLNMTPVSDGIDLALHVRNKTSRDWHDLVSITGCVSPLGWGIWKQYGVPQDQAPHSAPLFADNESRDKTYISTSEGPFLLTDRTKHFFDEDTLKRVQSLPYQTNVFRVAEHRPAPPFIDRGIVARWNQQTNWLLGFAWQNCLCVNANNPMDCLHPTALIGPLQANAEKVIRGKIYLFPGALDELFTRCDRDLGGPT